MMMMKMIIIIISIKKKSQETTVFHGRQKLTSAIREFGSTLYVGLACAVPPTNTNFRLTYLLTRLQEAPYEDLPV